MILKYIALFAAIFILSEAAAVLDPGTTLKAQISGEIPKEPDTQEKWEKNKHLHSSKNNFTDTDDLNENDNTDVDANQEIQYNSVTHNDDNKLGHEKKIDTDISDHKSLQGHRTVDGESTEGDHNARTDQEYDDQMNIHETETNQSLRNGSLHTESADKTNKIKNHFVTNSETNETYDEDHANNINYSLDDNHTTDITEHEGMAQRKIDQPGGNIVITDRNDVVNKKDFNTHNQNFKLDKDTPFFHKIEEMRIDSVESNDNTVSTGKTNVVWDNPLSKITILDEIKEEHNNNNKKDQEQDEKFVYDDNGDGKLVKEKHYKELTDETKEHINTVTLENEPKLPSAIPIKVVFTNSILDQQKYQLNEKDEQEIESITPTTETAESTVEESTSNYELKPIAKGNNNDKEENDTTASVTVKSQENNDTQGEGATAQCNKNAKVDHQEDNDKSNNGNQDDDKNDHDTMILMIAETVEESTIS